MRSMEGEHQHCALRSAATTLSAEEALKGIEGKRLNDRPIWGRQRRVSKRSGAFFAGNVIVDLVSTVIGNDAVRFHLPLNFRHSHVYIVYIGIRIRSCIRYDIVF